MDLATSHLEKFFSGMLNAPNIITSVDAKKKDGKNP